MNGDWGLGIGDWAQSPIPNPQSPIPNPQSPIIYIISYLLKGLGFEDLSKKDMSALFKDIDLNNDNVISFYEFLLIMKKIKT